METPMPGERINKNDEVWKQQKITPAIRKEQIFYHHKPVLPKWKSKPNKHGYQKTCQQKSGFKEFSWYPPTFSVLKTTPPPKKTNKTADPP